MTRILFLAESYVPVLGGGERHIQALATHLARGQTPVTVLTRRSDASWPAAETLEGVRIVRVAPHGPGRTGKYFMLPGVVCALWNLREEYDVIVVRGTRVLGLPAVIVARLLRKLVVLQPEISGEIDGDVYTWGTRLHATIVSRLIRAIVRLRNRLLRRAAAYVAISKAIEREFATAGFPTSRLTLIQHGIDTRRFCPARREEKDALRLRLQLPVDALALIYVGRLLRGKGLEILIEAFERVAIGRPETMLVLVGAGEGQSLSMEAELRSRVERSDVRQRVLFTGRVEAVEEYLRAADLFVFPSLFEALPLAVIEAAACGLACVASDTGGIPDILEHDVSGVLVRPGDVDALVHAIKRLFQDSDIRARLGVAARSAALRSFALEANVARYDALFRMLHAKQD